MKNLLFIILLPLFSFAQKGPAGIGNTLKDVSLSLWLNASDINQNISSHVGVWLDQSGYKNNAHIDAGLGPLLKSKGLNKMQYLDFTASRNEYLVVSSRSSIECKELSLYVVGKIRQASIPWAGFVLKESGSDWEDGYGIGRYDDRNEFIGFTSDFKNTGIKAAFNINEYSILSLHHSIDTLTFYTQGKSAGSIAHTGPITQNDDVLWIGWTGDFLDGEIAEIILYNRESSAIQRMLIHNYLSSKYDLEIQDDLFIYDDSLQGNFDHDLTGIGMSKDKTMHLDACNGMVTINNPSHLDPDEYMLWAHNGFSLNKNNLIDVPGGVSIRLEREWRVAEVNQLVQEVELGSIDIQFDLSEFKHINPLELFLLIDSDDDGLFSNERPIAVDHVKDGSKIIFKNIKLLNNGSKFTLGSSTDESYVLKTLIDQFNISIIDSSINLNWSLNELLGVNSMLLYKTDEKVDHQLLEIINIYDNKDGATNFTFKDEYPSEYTTVYELLCVRNDFDDTIKIVESGVDFSFEKTVSEKLEMNKKQSELIEKNDQKEKAISQKDQELAYLFYLSIGVVIILFLVLIIYLNIRTSKSNKEREQLLEEINQLKHKGITKSLTETEVRNELELNKQKLEQAIDTKIGESAWMILNILLRDPSVSNKEIAQEVSLSIEGVSSSLRKMYVLFNVTDSSNKKIALLMEVIRISSEV